MVYKIVDASFHTNANGDMLIKGSRDSGYHFEVVINSKNPLVMIDVHNEYFNFKVKNKNAVYCIYYRDVDMRSIGAPMRKLNWAGTDKPAPTGMLYFIHDMIQEVQYYCYSRFYLKESDAELEVEYLRERYKESEKYISDLDFNVIVNELIRRYADVHGVSKQ